MATLEKIRSKSVMLFTVIIVALLAFILGDFLTSGRNFMGPGDTVAEANGVKVKFHEYQQRVTELSNQYKAQNQTVDNDVLSQQAIESLLNEKLMNKEYDRVGIQVTPKQLHAALYGQDNGMQTLYGLLNQMGPDAANAIVSKGVNSLDLYASAMQNPGKFGLPAEYGQAMKSAWLEMENQAEEGIRGQVYAQMVSSLFTSNKIDRKAIYNDDNEKRAFQYASQELSTVADKDVKLEDADYQKVYDLHKGMFKLSEDQSLISYIVVPLVPSEADYAAAQKKFDDVLVALAQSEGISALKDNADFRSETAKLTREKIQQNPQLRSILADSSATLTPGAVIPVRGSMNGQYVAVKVLGTSTGIDRVKFSQIVGTAAGIDSLRSKLTAASFDSIATANGGRPAQELSLVDLGPNADKRIVNLLETSPVGQVVYLADTIQQQGKDGKPVDTPIASAYLISERDAAVPVYELAVVDYTLTPSQETIKDLTQKFHAYVAKNSDAKAFQDNASKEGYNVSTAMVGASTPAIGYQGPRMPGLPDSRGAIRFALDNKAGKVSHVYNNQNGSNDYLLAVAIDEVFDGEYMPVSSKYVREMLQAEAMADKKAEKIIAGLNGKTTLAQYAAAMKGSVKNATSTFGDYSVDGVGFNENVLQGAVAGASKGKLVGPFRSNNAVFVIVAGDAKVEGRPSNDEENNQKFGSKFIRPMLANPQILIGDHRVTNNLLKMTQEEK